MEGACLLGKFEHLTNAEIEAVAGGHAGEPFRKHLEVCTDCRDEIDHRRDWNNKVALLRAGDRQAAGSDCPSAEELARLAAGFDVPGSEKLAEHVATCDRCGGILRDAGLDSDMEDPMILSLRTAAPEWQTRMAGKFLNAANAGRRGRPLFPLLAVAAAVVLAVGAGLWWHDRSNDPVRLLAAAYTSARPFEYRLRDEGYGPVRQRKSGSLSAFDRPESLGRAEAEIRRRLGGDESRPDLAQLKGRAELMEGQFQAAVEDLTRASELAPSAEVLADLGAAYALRGDAERRSADYGHAADLFLRALRLEPDNLNALFNLAITYERVWMVDEAIATWKKLLRTEKRQPWADEARGRLEEVERKKRARQTALDRIPEDPKAFLTLAKAGDYDAENLQNTFWSRWLPAAKSDPAAAVAARLLAEAWMNRFGDRLLKDAFDEAAGAGAGDLPGMAGSAIMDNFHGRNDEVLARAEEEIRRLEASGRKAAAVRMKVEQAYSYRRSTRHEPCLAITGKLLSELDAGKYPWLAGRTRLEHSVCMSRAGGMGPARQEREETARQAAARGLASLALQADGLVTSIDALSGNSSAVWERAPRGLAAYWTSAASESRAQQAFYDMALAARGMGWKEAAIMAQTAAVESMSRLGNPQLEALNRVYLASLLAEGGQQREAATELDRADTLFRRLPRGTTVANLMLDGHLRKAEALAAGAAPERAIEELGALLRMPGFSSLQDRMRARQAEGMALTAKGDWQAAEPHFREAISLAGAHLRSFSQPLSRIAAAEMALDSRRNLTQIALLRRGDPAGALRTWEERWADLARSGPVAASAGGASAVTLTYVLLPAGVAAFLTSGSEVKGSLLPDPPAVLEAEIRAFHRLCASPASNSAVLRADGRKLYSRLIQPYAREVAGARRVLIESDQWLSSLPFAALVDEGGRYLAEKHAVGAISSLADAGGQRDGGFSRDTAAVIVAAPDAGAASGLPFLSGAVREANELAARMTHPVLLESPVAPAASLARQMASAGLVHFTGHGWSNGGNAALIVARNAEGGRQDLTATDLGALNWKPCRLAVLSACLTAAGEERGPVNPHSLVRALLAAGARRVVASRWSVDGESTRALMEHFYDALFSGSAPVEALERASAKIRGTGEWEHPYYWAAFDVFGAP